MSRRNTGRRRALVLAGAMLAVTGTTVLGAPAAGAAEPVSEPIRTTTVTCPAEATTVERRFVIPADGFTYTIEVQLAGAAGGSNSGTAGGRGGRVDATVTVTGPGTITARIPCIDSDGANAGYPLGGDFGTGGSQGESGSAGGGAAVLNVSGVTGPGNFVSPTNVIRAGGGGGAGGRGAVLTVFPTAGGVGGAGGAVAGSGADGGGVEPGAGGEGGAVMTTGSLPAVVGRDGGDANPDGLSGGGGSGGGGCAAGAGGGSGTNGAGGGGGGGATSCALSNPLVSNVRFVDGANGSRDGFATVTIVQIAIPVPPQDCFCDYIQTEPVDQTGEVGAPVTLTASGESFDDQLSAQWQVLSADGQFSDIPGATAIDVRTGAPSDVVTFTTSYATTVPAEATGYRVVVTGSGGVDTSRTVLVSPAVPGPPSVTTSPEPVTVDAGEQASFTVAASGSPAPSVQWQKAAANTDTPAFADISGATSSTYAFTATAPDNGSRYRAVLTSSEGTATSEAALLTVRSAPVVLTSPQDATAAAGESVTFTASAAGEPAPTVQWQRSADGTTYTDIDGATSPTYTLTVAEVDGGARFRAVFGNTLGTAETTAATLTLVTAPTITSAASAPFTVGAAGTFDVTTTGAPTLTLAGALPSGLEFTDDGDGTGTLAGTPAAGSVGSYPVTVTATNGAGSVTQALSVEVGAAATTTTLTVPGGEPVVGTPLTLTATVAAVSPATLTPTGEVTFSDGGTTLGTAPLDASGTATLTVPDLAVGTHALSAAYGGSADAAASSSATAEQVVTYGIALLYDPDRPVRAGATVPVRIALVDAAGTNLSSAAVAVTSDAGGFAYDPGLQGGGYQLDLRTERGTPPGGYSLSFSVDGDPVVHEAPYRLR